MIRMIKTIPQLFAAVLAVCAHVCLGPAGARDGLRFTTI